MEFACVRKVLFKSRRKIIENHCASFVHAYYLGALMNGIIERYNMNIKSMFYTLIGSVAAT